MSETRCVWGRGLAWGLVVLVPACGATRDNGGSGETGESGETGDTSSQLVAGREAANKAAASFARVSQTPLPGASIPKYVDPVPTFVGARVDGRLPVVVKTVEFQQKVLPESIYAALPPPFAAGTYVWGYKLNGADPHWPAPTIEARRSIPTAVTYFNDLHGPHGAPPVLAAYLSVDQTLHWADPLGTMERYDCMAGPPYERPCVRPYRGPWPLATHLHGGEVPSIFDGHPDSWFTPHFGIVGPDFSTNTFVYPNRQEPATLWYHDHVLGITRLNVFAGLAGFYFLRDHRDTGLDDNPIRLPAGLYEDELVIQGRRFDTRGQLLFPDGTPPGLNGPPPNPDIHPFWIPEFVGDVTTVNGKSWPFLEVEPRRYRFRLANGESARFLDLHLTDLDSGSPGPTFWQIGTDGGLLESPVELSNLVLGPGERADLIVDFAGRKGSRVTLVNTANAPYPDGEPPDPAVEGQIMQFRIDLPLRGTDQSFNPQAPLTSLRAEPIVQLSPAVSGRRPDVKRQLVLVERMSPETDSPLAALLNNTSWSGIIEGSSPKEPVRDSVPNRSGDSMTELPQVGATEQWEIANLTGDAHPIHLHLVQFQLLDRQPFDSEAYMAAWEASFPGGTFGGVTYPPGEYIPTFGPPLPYNQINAAGAVGGNPDFTPFLNGPAEPPPPNEAGWKDTVRMMPQAVTRIMVRWAPQHVPIEGVRPGQNRYPFDPTRGPGYVWHCHILDHEDNEMMRPFAVRR